VAKYPFLSQEWVDAAHAIRDEFKDQAPAPAHAMRMNQVITDVPFGDGDIDAHIDTSAGDLDMGLGHIDNPDLTAKAILVNQDPQAGMQAFMSGKIKVQGDMTKLMAMQSQAPDAVSQQIAERVKEITE
jgi:hypothetical protein